MERRTTSLNGRGSVVVEKELITDPVVVENELVADTDTAGEINHQKTSVLTPEQKTDPVEEFQGDTEQPLEQPKNKQKRKLPKALILAGLGVGAIAAIDNTIRREAFVMAFNDCFYFIAWALLLSGIAIVFFKRVKAKGGAGAH